MFFKSQRAILVLGLDGSFGRWLGIEDCMWQGPAGLVLLKRSLAQEYPSRPSVHNLFVNLLGVGDATHQDILQAIEMRKTTGSHLEGMTKLYDALNETVDWMISGAEIRYDS